MMICLTWAIFVSCMPRTFAIASAIGTGCDAIMRSSVASKDLLDWASHANRSS